MNSRREFKPLRITFRLMSPVALTYPWVFFDALIAHLYWRRHDPELYRALPSKQVWKLIRGKSSGKHILPLKMTGDVYHASVSFFDAEDRGVVEIYKRFCEKRLPYGRFGRRKLDRGRGWFRDWRIRLVTVPAKTVTFYACGVKEEIEELLKGVPYIGKKGAAGFGFVKDFKVEEIDGDLSLVKDDVAMRPIPIWMLEWTSDVVMMAYKPPYWAKENVAPCAPPGAHVRLKRKVSRRGSRDEGVLSPVVPNA